MRLARTTLLALGSLAAARLFAQTQCPPGNVVIPNYDVSAPNCVGTSCTVTATWSAPSGAGPNTQYDVYMTQVADYCATFSNYTVVGTTAATQFDVRGIPRGTVYAIFIRQKGCNNVQTQYSLVADTFALPPGRPTLSARVTGTDVTLTFSQPDSRAGYVALQRSVGVAGYTQLGFTLSIGNYCPAGSSKTFTDSGLATGVYTYRVVSTGNFASQGTLFSDTVTVTIGNPCPAPGAPQLSSATSSVPSGQSFVVNWTAASSLGPGGTYVLETSKNGFSSVDTSVRTNLTSSVISTTASGSDVGVSVRVRAVQSCGTEGANSNVIVVKAAAVGASVIVTKVDTSLVVRSGSPLPSGQIRLRNVGGRSTQVRLSLPPNVTELAVSPAALDLAPGVEGTAMLAATSAASSLTSPISGTLGALYDQDRLLIPYALAVAGAPASARASRATLVFSAPKGQNPPTLQVTISVTPPASGVTLTSDVGPGGAWLVLPAALRQPVPASGQVTLTLNVDRTLRTRQEGTPPLRTFLRLTPAGGNPTTDAAVIEVVDAEPPAVRAGNDRTLAGTRPLAAPAAGTSFIIPTTVKSAPTANQLFVTDGWLRNLSGADVNADFYFTPEGKNGLTDASVLKATTTIAAGNTFRLSDLVSTVFGTSGTSGAVEVRSSSPGSLTLRATVESVIGGDAASRYGSEISTVPYGSGVGVGGGTLIIPGIDEDAKNRANLILSETTGNDVNVRVTVTDAKGVAQGSKDYFVAAYGKSQVNGIVNSVAGRTISGGSATVTATSGSGKVVPLATVIDNASGSFSAIRGRLARTAVSGASAETTSAKGELAAPPSSYLIPSTVRTIGANNTQFTTGLSLTNGTLTAANLTLTYTYTDQDDGGAIKSAQKPLALPGLGSIPKELGSDVVAAFFGVTNRSFGSILVEGDVAKVTGVAAISAQVDPNDPSKGLRTAQVNGVFLDGPEVMGAGEVERRFAGAEKSVQKRTNLILLEVAGQSATVLVRLNSAAGAKLAEQTFSVGPNQYFQINDVFGDGGVKLGDGPFQNVEVTTQVVSGSGRVLAIATVNDNISRNPQIFVLTQPGPGDPTFGY